MVTADELKQEAREADARRFFLGQMSEAEKVAFEESFVADQSLFEQVRAVEDELVEAYARGTLAPAEREKFERSFLTSARRRGRVEFTRAMLGRLAERGGEVAAAEQTGRMATANPSAWNSIVSFFKTPAPAFGAAFAALALIVGGWFLLRAPNRPEVARQAAPTPASQSALPDANENPPAGTNLNSHVEPPDGANASHNAKTETPHDNQNQNTPKRPADVATPTLALFAGAVRGGGKIPELNLPKGAPGANLRLRLESQDYKVYRAEVVDPDGARVFRSGDLKAGNSVVNLYVPARSLGRGDYLIKLSALNPQNETESVADYPLRVNRK